MTTIARFRVENAFDDFVRGVFNQSAHNETVGFRMDVTEDAKQYVVRADIPGVSKDAINIEIDGNQVAISTEVKQERDAKEGEKQLRQERY